MANGTRKRGRAREQSLDYVEWTSSVRDFEQREIERRRRSRGKTSGGWQDPGKKLTLASDLTGLALSGGGVRSAAACLGAIQALHVHGRLDQFDYLSTVSGGGYAGACLALAQADISGGKYPFGEDVRDSQCVSHLRDYSNYLMPRSRSLGRNLADGAVIVLRGLVANTICVLPFLLAAVLVSAWVFPGHPRGGALSWWPALDGAATGWAVALSFVAFDLAAGLALVLALWAILRAFPELDRLTSDTDSGLLSISRWLFGLALLVVLVELQPFAVDAVDAAAKRQEVMEWLRGFVAVAVPFAGAVAGFASKLGNFLKHSERDGGWMVTIRRWGAKLLLYAAAAVVPLLLWLAYLKLTDTLIKQPELWWPVFGLWLVTAVLIWFMRPNGYSLHGFYRDRLAAAFLFPVGTGEKKRNPRLSDLQWSNGPYPIINAALNIQGSPAANRRGREADFFIFTPDHIGSDLTGYAPVSGPQGFETLDRRIDLASAIAISGAAVSANMGSHTVRALSPTLSLLNVRLGYWIKNPRPPKPGNWLALAWRWISNRAYLLIEMFNRADEDRPHLYISDGGHIENLGIYQLLERRCGVIFAVDAEADPSWSCGSLLKLERYARIDLGVRIEVPWEQIAAQSTTTSRELREGAAKCVHGPHCAVGPIYYQDGTVGVLVYVKSSLTGDEKDYLIDYARRNPAFPHESTSDQFFSEEQFEMYRALGFHMVNRFFHGDQVATFPGDGEAGLDADAIRAILAALLPDSRSAAAAKGAEGKP
ncbi:MAG TPA: patatin-like phospholipase family protein [Sphingomicrobium sp.]